jgi:hypothetical protein
VPGDVLTAILGVLAGGAEGYNAANTRKREQQASAEEASKERQIRRELLSLEVGARAKEGTEGRKLAREELLQQREIAGLRLQAERDALNQEISFKTRQMLDANAIERVKLEADVAQNKARLGQIDKELALKGRELDIEQAATLGTGKLGTGAPTKGAKAGGGGKETAVQNLVNETIKSFISASGSTGKLPTGVEAGTFITDLLNNPVVSAAYGIPQPPKEETKIGGKRSTPSTNPNLGSQVGNIQDASDVMEGGYKGLLQFMEGFGDTGPLVTQSKYIEGVNRNKKKQAHLR